MKVVRGYKTELAPTSEQYVLFCQCAGASRYAYNYGLTRKQEAYQAGQPTPYCNDLQRELTARKHDDLPWLLPLSKWIVQNALRDLDVAFKHFFERCRLKKEGKWRGPCGYPRYKSRKRGRGSFRLDCPIHVFDDAVQLPKLGKVKLKEKGYIPTWGVKLLSATISECAGKWFISVQVREEHSEPMPATGPAIGVDVGVKTLATLSTGQTIANPKALRSRLKQLRQVSRRHSRKAKGSKNREKSRRKLARLHAKIANIRRDTLHKATSQLIGAKTKLAEMRPRVIVLEDLHIKGMVKNPKLSRAVADVGMHEFRRQVEYKARYAGIEVQFVSRWFPSSKTCHACQYELDVRAWTCPNCGTVHDRDLNAALVLAGQAR